MEESPTKAYNPVKDDDYEESKGSELRQKEFGPTQQASVAGANLSPAVEP